MKVNFIMLFITLLISGLIGFGFYRWDNDLELDLIASGLLFIYLATSISVSRPASPRSGTMIKLASSVFFFVFLILNILFAVFEVSETLYILVNGVGLCLWILILYGVARTET